MIQYSHMKDYQNNLPDLLTVFFQAHQLQQDHFQFLLNSNQVINQDQNNLFLKFNKIIEMSIVSCQQLKLLLVL